MKAQDFFKKELDMIDYWRDQVVNNAIQTAFKRFEFVLVDYLTNKQWFQKGEKSDGKKIKPKYKDITVKIKKRKGDPYDRVTLRDTGKLYKSIKLIVGERAVTITVGVEYWMALEEKYGHKILGIQDKFLEEFCENYIIPEIKKQIDDTITGF